MLDEYRGAFSAEHLRALLVACEALPDRDENVARLRRFVEDHVARLNVSDHRRLIRAFARWHVLPRLHRRHPDHVPPNAAYRCREQLTTASRMLFLAIPITPTSRPQHFSVSTDRWARARTLLHDEGSATVSDRVAACLVLLYAQPITRIAKLTTSHLRRNDLGASSSSSMTRRAATASRCCPNSRSYSLNYPADRP